jgi:hypothetical protein
MQRRFRIVLERLFAPAALRMSATASSDSSAARLPEPMIGHNITDRSLAMKRDFGRLKSASHGNSDPPESKLSP